ncbi:MAG TPA: hypothetical protein VF494_02755 [Candidatus Limnocylindrales bacterium]
MAKDVLEQDLQGDGGPPQVDPTIQGGESIVVGQARAERRSGAEWIVTVRGSALAAAG